MNEVDFYEWRANKYGLDHKARGDLDELDELDDLLPRRRPASSDADRPNPDAEQEALDRLHAEREELDRWMNEQEERDLQSKLDDWDDLATLDELLIPSPERDNKPEGDFPQTARETEQRSFSANDQADHPRSTIDQAISCKNIKLAERLQSGVFPQEALAKPASKKRCTPRLAGLLTILHHAQASTLAVLGELQTLKSSCGHSADTRIEGEIRRRSAALEFQQSLARSAAGEVSLPDWERRLPPETKRAFALLALARHPDAKSFTFRLGHEVAEAALRAKHGPTDYLARILQRLGLTQAAFVIERSTGESDENNPYHIHGVAVIPAGLLDELTREAIGSDGKSRPSKLRALLAPPRCNDAKAPIRGYRQRYSNKAIDIEPVRTAGAWFRYITKEIDFTTRDISARPDYASRSAIQAGKALYESIRDWVTANPIRLRGTSP